MTFSCNQAFVALATNSFERLIGFYSNLLVQPPQSYIPEKYAEFRFPGLRLGIFVPKASNQQEFSPQAKTSMSLCLEVHDLEAAIAHLTHLGYPPPGNIQVASHGREIYAYDPEGNRLILHQAQELEFL